MKDGFIRVAAATPAVRVGDCDFNAWSIIQEARQAAGLGARLLVLPELCLTGYTCGDLFLQPVLLEGAADGLRLICKETKLLDMLLVVGLPVRHQGKLYNCGAVVYHGALLGIVTKTCLPNYGEFTEGRYFVPAFQGVQENLEFEDLAPEGTGGVPMGAALLFCAGEMPNFTLAVELCEDLWSICPPSIAHAAAGATVIANLSASNDQMDKHNQRRSLVTGQSSRLICGYVYADAGEGESTMDQVFSAHNLIAEYGTLLAQAKRFRNEMVWSELDVDRLARERMRITTFPAQEQEGYRRITFSMPLSETRLSRGISPLPFLPDRESDWDACCENILQIQAGGLKKRLAHSCARSAVVGVSGGLDSALALLVTVRAMDLLERPREEILAVTMPCFGTTARTKGNAELLAEHLEVTLRQVDISTAVTRHFADIGQEKDRFDVTFENAQARERTQVLMDLANQRNGLVVGTGDLSELALGWATYNGDHMSMYGVNASVPKTLVRRLVEYEASLCKDDRLRKVLRDILETPVSPELLPPVDGKIEQKTEDLVGPYELHDFFLYYLVRWGFPPRKIYRLALQAFRGTYDGETVCKWLKTFCRRFFQQQFKRSCMPDGPKVGPVSLSPRGDWRMPSDAVAALWLADVEALSPKVPPASV